LHENLQVMKMLKKFCLIQYSETSINRTLRKPTLSQYRPNFFKSLPDSSLHRKSVKTGHPYKPALFFCPSAGQFSKVSLSFYNYKVPKPVVSKSKNIGTCVSGWKLKDSSAGWNGGGGIVDACCIPTSEQ
jgi:hypothetical protein